MKIRATQNFLDQLDELSAQDQGEVLEFVRMIRVGEIEGERISLSDLTDGERHGIEKAQNSQRVDFELDS